MKADEYSSLVKKLNDIISEVFPEGDILDYYTPYTINFTNSFQFIPETLKNHCYMLDDPNYIARLSALPGASYMRQCKEPGDSYHVRHLITVDEALKMSNNKTKFIIEFSSIYQGLVNELAKRVSSLANYEVSFFLPGRGQREVFLGLPYENAIHVELRMIATLK